MNFKAKFITIINMGNDKSLSVLAFDSFKLVFSAIQEVIAILINRVN